MKKRDRIINVILVAVAVAVVALFALNVRKGATADSVAVLKTLGMTCGSCAAKIEKALKPLKGVAGIEVDVNGGWVLVGYDSKATGPDPFAGMVAKTGYRSWLMQQLSIAEFRTITGREFGAKAAQAGCGGCGSGSGCGGANANSNRNNN